MDELIAAINKITIEMNHSLKEKNIDEFEKQLMARNVLMDQVNQYKAENPDFQYSLDAKKMLEDSLQLDRILSPQLKELMNKTQTELNQLKKQKQVSKKYTPYMKQTNGAFFDTKK